MPMRALAIAIALTTMPVADALAFSSVRQYDDPANEGGGGGRWYTGSPLDSLTCSACHTGEFEFPVAGTGVPAEGFDPGATYDIAVTWPAQLQHVSLMVEFTNSDGVGAGELIEVDPDELSNDQKCASGTNPISIFEARHGRRVLALDDCGAKAGRFRWTAPENFMDEVDLYISGVAADGSDTPENDGVLAMIQPLGGASTQGGCRITQSGGRGEWTWLAVVGLLGLDRRRRREGRRRQ
jgi:hypothetical protein